MLQYASNVHEDYMHFLFQQIKPDWFAPESSILHSVGEPKLPNVHK